MKPDRRKLSGEDAETGACVPPQQHTHLEAGHFRHVLDFSRGAMVEIEKRDDGVYAIRDG